MSARFSSLKPSLTNSFKSGSDNSRSNFNGDSNGGFESSYKSNLNSVYPTNKKNNYVTPAKRNRHNIGSSFSSNSRESKQAFKQKPLFKEKTGDFPSLGEALKTLGTNEQENERISFANLIKTKEQLVEEKKQEIDTVPPGWIRWRTDPQTNKWILERGPISKERHRFIKWVDEFKESRKRVAFEEYLDRVEREEYEDFMFNGPTYVQSWELEDEYNYDSEPDILEDTLSDSDENEYVDENDVY